MVTITYDSYEKLATNCVPDLNPAPEVETPGQAKSPPLQKDQGYTTACCLCSSLRVVAFARTVSPTIIIPEGMVFWPPESGDKGVSFGCQPSKTGTRPFKALLQERTGSLECGMYEQENSTCLLRSLGRNNQPLDTCLTRNLGTCLVAQWLGLCTSTAGSTVWVQSQVEELGSCMPQCGKNNIN